MNAQIESKSILSNPTVLERAIIYARVSTDEQAESGTNTLRHNRQGWLIFECEIDLD